MIIQTGMRTDIPAFYSEWFFNRIKEGYVLVRNPYNPSTVTKYILSPEVVDSVGWRYDPIFISETYTVEKHIAYFGQMAKNLSGYTKTCVISFINLYKKVQRNFPEVRTVNMRERIELGKAFVEIGEKYGMIIKSCAEGDELALYGVNCNGCMTIETFETALHERLDAPKRKSPRSECACFLGNDIGSYDTCGHLCRYCYANTNAEQVRLNMKSHDPKSPFLLGGNQPGDKVHQPKQESWINRQMRLEL